MDYTKTSFQTYFWARVPATHAFDNVGARYRQLTSRLTRDYRRSRGTEAQSFWLSQACVNSTQRLLDNSRIRQLADCRLADWTTRGLDKSRTGQLADAIGDFACLVFLFGGICETATCPVRELAYPRVVQLPTQQ